jgi:hypothetical protein
MQINIVIHIVLQWLDASIWLFLPGLPTFVMVGTTGIPL